MLAHTHTHTSTLGDTQFVAPLSPPTSDICHSQSVQQATHLSSVVLPLCAGGGAETEGELKTGEEGTEGQRQKGREERGEGEKRAQRRQGELLLVAGCSPLLANW